MLQGRTNITHGKFFMEKIFTTMPGKGLSFLIEI
jgi:hypothetical protein